MRRFLARVPSVVWIGVIFWAVNAGFVAFYPIVTGDEVIGNDPASEWVLHGAVRSSLFEELPGFERGYFLQPPGQFLTGVVAYGTLGFGLVQTRLAALTWGALAVIAVGFLGEACCRSRRAGVLSAAILALHPEFTFTVAQARMDGQAIALLAAGCLAFFSRHSAGDAGTRLRRLMLSGILIGLAGITHPVASFWALGLVAAALLSSPRMSARELMVWMSLVGLPTLVWLGFAARWPHEFAVQFMSHGRSKLTNFNIVTQLMLEAQRWLKTYAYAPWLPLAFLAGARWWWRAPALTPEMRREFGILTIIVFVATTFLLNKESGPYNLYPAVLLTVMASGWIDAMWQRAGDASLAMRRAAAVAGVLLGTSLLVKFLVPRVVAVTVQREARDYAAITAEVGALIPPGSVVSGSPEYFYAVKSTGSWLRLAVAPDPNRHNFVIYPSRLEPVAFPGFVRIAEIGKPMPAVFGRTFNAGYDYRAVIFARAPK